MTRHHIVLGLVLGLLTGAPAPAQEKLTAAQLIARVRENEARYADIEIRYTTRLHTPDGQPGDPKAVSSVTRARSVKQKAMARYEGDVFTDGAATPGTRYRFAFDGTVARLNRDGETETLPRGVRHDDGVFQPHNLTLGLDVFVPLSVWLEGGEELRTHRGAFYGWTEANIRPRPVGSERVRGIDCEKMVCGCYFPDGKGGWELGETITLWLSPAHNYLPVQEECVKADTPDALQSAVVCEDFREVRRGVWIPYRTTTTRYDRFAAGRVKTQVQTVEVEAVRTDPGHPVEFFRDVSLPRP